MSTVAHITEEEKKVIHDAYQRLLASFKVPYDDKDKVMIKEAYELAMEAHAPQRRKSGEPYVLHPLEVARICAEEIGLGSTAIICAILHDVVEDTPVTQEEIEAQFGHKVGKIVDGLTKLDGTYTKNSPQAENFKKVLSTLVEDVRVVLIKMADRLHNMRTLGAMKREKQLKIAAETSYVYAPLAHRLGLYNIKTEFEDLCMQITEPDEYQEISSKISAANQSHQLYIAEFTEPIKRKLDEIGLKYRVTGRMKSIPSIWHKIKTKNVPFEEIYDIFAIRIILDTPLDREKRDAWQAYSVVTDVYKPIPERLKDWITTPKSNGYESLHTTVIGPRGSFVEVQIRSERMDEIAEKGFAAHWKYKGVSGQPDVYDNWLNNIRSLLEGGESDATEFLADFMTNLFKDEVYVYTPAGDAIVLPNGATALDFAFAIHSDVGYHCTAVKVNNRLVPLGHELQNGDKVTVITNNNQKPNDDWLRIVKTGKARSKIRSSIKEERRRTGELGKESLQRKLKNIKADFDPAVDALIKHFGYRSRLDLYYAIATGDVDLAATLKKFEVVNHQLEPIADDQSKMKAARSSGDASESDIIRQREKTRPTVLINDEPGEQYNYVFSPCCNPVQGDKIFGYVTSGAGIKIHRTNCPNADHIMANYGYRMVKAEWAGTKSSAFVASLTIIGVDDGPGVIQRLTHLLADKLGINITSFSIDGREGYFEGRVSLSVMNTDQLYLVIKELKSLEGISTVTRTA